MRTTQGTTGADLLTSIWRHSLKSHAMPKFLGPDNFQGQPLLHVTHNLPSHAMAI